MTEISVRVDTLIYELREEMEAMTDEQRLEVILNIMDDYCLDCGRRAKRCYCTRDD